MNKLNLLIVIFLAFSCSKEKAEELKITSFDQITGIWKSESACGGYSGACGYSTDQHYEQMIFSADGQLIEKKNDSIILIAKYSILKAEDSWGTLIMNNVISDYWMYDHYEYSISIINNRLMVTRGDMFYTYKKIK
jgi:hypothetical protein